jgi:membrane-bound lytic murein transglycosylase F
MKRRALIVLVAGGVLLSVLLWFWPELGGGRDPRDRWSVPLVKRDLDDIRKDTLRALVIEHPLTYERLRGGETGLEFELLERFARAEGVPLKAIVAPHPDSLLPMLQRGVGDLIAARLSGNNSFGRAIARTHAYRYVSPVIATLRPDRVLGIRPDPHPDTVWVSCGSPFAQRDRRSPGMEAVAAAEKHQPGIFTDTSAVADMPLINVSLGRIEAALVTSSEAAYAAERFPQLSFKVDEDVSAPLYYGLRRNSPRLRTAIDDWLAATDEKEARTMIMSAYGSEIPERGAMGRKRKQAVEGDPISPFDSLFQQHAGTHDWELLAAIAFKESRFDSAAISSKGAQGLMQMMPKTAAIMGTDSMHLVEGQIQAAAKYLSTLDSIWVRSVPRADERLRFVLAAYNAGPGHVLDAQRLARSLGLDPHRWEGNVERAITLLALPRYFSRPEIQSGPCKGAQTFVYVREVTGLFEEFRAITERVDP